MKVEYYSNNSGGYDWLNESQWADLAGEGWELTNFSGPCTPDDRPKYATKDFPDLGSAIREWERLTGERSAELGCSCCGPPHDFRGRYADGRSEYWSPSYPSYGNEYAA